MNITILLSFIISVFFTILFIYLGKTVNFCCDSIHKNHAVHSDPTPKCGGLSIYISIFFILFLIHHSYLPLIIFSFPIFAYGLYDDFKGNTSQIVRLFIMAICSIGVFFYFGIYIKDIGLFSLPKIIGIPFTIFCIVGIASAINFIDGLNGLATGVCIISLIFYALVTYQLNDFQLFILNIILILSILGFFIFNFPFGKIFLGDGGAYFLGFIVAILSIILVDKHSKISPWYPLNVFSYPVIETLVTIKRRLYKKRSKGTPFFESEKLHLHTLLFKRKTRKNPLASTYLLTFHFIINIFAYFLRSNLVGLIILFIIVWIVYLKWYSKMFIKTIQ